MYAVKANRIYKIEESEKQSFINRGYKIAELKNGKLVYEKVETKEDKEIAKLEAKVKELEKELEEALKEDKKKKREGK